MLTRTDRRGKTTSYTYNSRGQIDSITDPMDVVTNFIYNSDHRLYQVKRSGLILSTSTYDTIGRLKTSRDATGLLLSYDYNDLNNLTTITYPDGKTEVYEYNSPFSPMIPTAVTDRAGRKTSYSYGFGKRRLSITNPEGGVISYDYDLNGNATAFTDPNSNSTLFAYDASNRLIKRTYADGRSHSFEYNARGLLSRQANGRGQKISYYYNESGRLLTIDYSGSNTPDVHYTYDEFNRLTTVEDGRGVTNFGYYENSTLVKTIDGPWENDTLTYSYDDAGKVVSIQLENGQTRTYDYDSLGRLQTIGIGGKKFLYEYMDEISPLVKKLVRPNSTKTSYIYDGMNRLLELVNANGSANELSRYSYHYNDQDLRDRETITGGLAAPAQTQGVQVSDFNNLNQLLGSSNPDQSFIYDADGNMVEGYTKDGYRFIADYDRENRLRLIEYSDGDGVAHRTEYLYGYDSFLSVIKRYENNVLKSDTRIIRDGHLAIQERDGDNTVIREYLWGKSLGGGIGGLLQMSQAGSDYYYLYDGKGNVVSVLDSAGTTVASYRYNSFGKLLATSGDLNQPFQFSTKRFDPGTGLSYYGYRFYNPQIERWMNRDPLGEDGGINLYGFASNDPVNLVDPWGLFVFGVFGGGSGGIGGVIDGSAAVVVDHTGDVALAVDVAGSAGPMATADLSAGVVIAPFAKTSDLAGESKRVNLGFGLFGVSIAIPDNPWNTAVSIDILPGFDFGITYGAGNTWLFGEDQESPCK